ncbi:MAG: HNH endonuclease, partial [Anaerolineae bacterium]
MLANPRTVNRQLSSSLSGATAHVVRETAPAYEVADTDVGIPDAATVHGLLMSLKALGNEVRLALLDALVTMHDGKLCMELGYSNFYQYCDREMGFGRSTAYEYLRAGKALLVLPRLRTLFKTGELSWQQVRGITRVATASTEAAWLKFAAEASAQELEAEVSQAKRAGRDLPRDRRHGLPNLLVRLSFDLTLEEKERLRAALAQVREALDGGTDADGNGTRGPGAGADGRPALVRWCDGILSGAIPAGPGHTSGTPRRPTPAQTILYRSCPECHKATVDTQDGPVAVSPERIAELAPHSQRVTITPDDEVVAENLPAGEADAPNSAALARKVIHRDGLVCQNPACGSRTNLQAHHIVFRSAGGPTTPSNEVTVCDRCHALIHADLLEVTGHADSPKWTPRPRANGVKVRDAEALARR